MELEECVANFVGKPAAIVTGMGYVTNSAILPVLIGKVQIVCKSYFSCFICGYIYLLIWSFTGRFDYQ